LFSIIIYTLLSIPDMHQYSYSSGPPCAGDKGHTLKSSFEVKLEKIKAFAEDLPVPHKSPIPSTVGMESKDLPRTMHLEPSRDEDISGPSSISVAGFMNSCSDAARTAKAMLTFLYSTEVS
jgi:hypothetical protein